MVAASPTTSPSTRPTEPSAAPIAIASIPIVSHKDIESDVTDFVNGLQCCSGAAENRAFNMFRKKSLQELNRL
jgi:hypothetical protein